MKVKNKLYRKFKSSKLFNGLITDYGFRTVAFFVCALTVNIIIAGFNAATGILYLSVWYGALALYYIALALQRGVLLLSRQIAKRKYADDVEKYNYSAGKIYVANGVVLLLLQAALTVAIVQLVTTEKPAKTGMIIAIATAAYAFYKIIAAIVNLVKTKKYNDLVLHTIRRVNFVDSAVSMLALTSTMVSTFGDFESMRTMLSCVAVGVSIVTVSVGLTMIVKGCVRLRKSGKS